MAIDMLQEKIRKLKNPSVIMFSGETDQIPDCILEAQPVLTSAYRHYCVTLMKELQAIVPAVRFNMGGFCLLGDDGIGTLRILLREAKQMGYYVLLDAPEILSPAAAKMTAESLWGEGSIYPCDGLVISGYLGSDVIKPFLPYCKEGKKDIFVVARTANKSAPELQDLLSGGRLVHMAAADHVNRYGSDTAGKFGYTNVGVLAAASSAESLRNLRAKYPKLFLQQCIQLFVQYPQPGIFLHRQPQNLAFQFRPFQVYITIRNRNMIRLTDVVKEYPNGTHALNGLSLEIKDGEFVFMVGPSGSGKSTLMNIIGCLDVADAGQYLLDGLPIESYTENQLARIRNEKIGFVFQQFNLIQKLSAEENVELPLIYQKVKKSERQRRVKEALEKVGLPHRAKHLPTELSGGQQQRVAIARAIVTKPKLILADEPTGALDSKTSREIIDIFHDLHRQGNTIVLITHDNNIAKEAERAIHILDGQISEVTL